MSEEEARKIVDTIKQEEFPYALAIAKAYEQLQQENKELKETLKDTTHCFDEEEHQILIKENEKLKGLKKMNNSKKIVDLDMKRKEELISKIRECDSLHNNCDFLLEHNDCDDIVEYIDKLNNAINNFEKWLEKTADKAIGTEYGVFMNCLDKLQKLKEGKK